MDETFFLCCGACKECKVRSSGCWRWGREYTCTVKCKAEEERALACLAVSCTLEQLDIDTSVSDTQSEVYSGFAPVCSANTSTYWRRFMAFTANVWSSILTAAKLQNKTINSALIIASEHRWIKSSVQRTIMRKWTPAAERMGFGWAQSSWVWKSTNGWSDIAKVTGSSAKKSSSLIIRLPNVWPGAWAQLPSSVRSVQSLKRWILALSSHRCMPVS